MYEIDDFLYDFLKDFWYKIYFKFLLVFKVMYELCCIIILVMLGDVSLILQEFEEDFCSEDEQELNIISNC